MEHIALLRAQADEFLLDFGKNALRKLHALLFAVHHQVGAVVHERIDQAVAQRAAQKARLLA